MLIYLSEVTPRIQYVFETVFTDHLGIDFQLTTDKSEFDTCRQNKLNYSPGRISDEVFIKAHPLLFQKDILEFNVAITKKNDVTLLFPNDNACSLGFDIFSAIFYMITRYEEYMPFEADEHQRFTAVKSIAFKNNFLNLPVVEIWIEELKDLLKKEYTSINFKKHHFQSIATYDIDVAYAYKGRSFIRNLTAICKDLIQLKTKNISARFKTFLNKKNDPWNVYDFIQTTVTANNLKCIFFFLSGNYSKYDKNLHPESIEMKQLINKISSFSDIGIHPSYYSSSSEKIKTEKKKLEKIIKKNITKSRQHFLKLTFPGTYNNLIEAGITEDYTMCFADKPGFRAGTCKPFYFYDLKQEKKTSLKIFPVTCMEGTFINYMRLSPDAALENMISLIKEVKKVNGIFISIWHNHTISETPEYSKWHGVHNLLIKKISLLNNRD
jgi:hypothetical protein